jgi:hypothetical protein
VPSQKIAHLRAGLRGIAHLDDHAGPDGAYTIASLYLDTADHRLFHANARESGDRYKVRVRNYPDTPGAPVFLEVKRRIGDVIRKTRIAISPDRWPAVLDAPRTPAEVAFVDLCGYRVLGPSTVVRYRREAWVSELEEYARVTFDCAIQAAPPTGWSLDVGGRGWRPIDHPIHTATRRAVTVVEMKFAGAAPVWMHRLIRRLDLRRFAFSKYGQGVESLMAPFGQRIAQSTWG